MFLKGLLVVASGTLPVPTGVSGFLWNPVGGGGGGTGGYNFSVSRGGGGGAEIIQNCIIPVTAGGSITIALGAGGVGGQGTVSTNEHDPVTIGTDGGDTTCNVISIRSHGGKAYPTAANNSVGGNGSPSGAGGGTHGAPAVNPDIGGSAGPGHIGTRAAPRLAGGSSAGTGSSGGTTQSGGPTQGFLPGTVGGTTSGGRAGGGSGGMTPFSKGTLAGIGGTGNTNTGGNSPAAGTYGGGGGGDGGHGGNFDTPPQFSGQAGGNGSAGAVMIMWIQSVA